jgi:hypothetical protein
MIRATPCYKQLGAAASRAFALRDTVSLALIAVGLAGRGGVAASRAGPTLLTPFARPRSSSRPRRRLPARARAFGPGPAYVAFLQHAFRVRPVPVPGAG